MEKFGDFYSLSSSPFTHSSQINPILPSQILSSKTLNGSHFLLPLTPAFLPFIQGEVNIFISLTKHKIRKPEAASTFSSLDF
ncbi:hypothetical protein V6Z11_D13G225000 [Gossypium hirsutum]